MRYLFTKNAPPPYSWTSVRLLKLSGVRVWNPFSPSLQLHTTYLPSSSGRISDQNTLSEKQNFKSHLDVFTPTWLYLLKQKHIHALKISLVQDGFNFGIQENKWRHLFITWIKSFLNAFASTFPLLGAKWTPSLTYLYSFLSYFNQEGLQLAKCLQ